MTSSRRVVVRRAGGPEVLEVVQSVPPTPARGQARIRVALAGVAYGDVMRRLGVLAPLRAFTPGYDVVGHIDAVGPGVDPERVGDRVVGLCRPVGLGGYADHVCLPETECVDVPAELSSEHALTLGLNYISAWQIVHRQLALPQGSTVLVHGASGGVGTALLDIGRRAGLTLYGTASAAKHGVVQERGAVAIDYRTEDFVERVLTETDGRGVDAVTDPIGGAHLAHSARAVRRGGTVVFFGLTGDVAQGWRAVARGLTTAACVWARPGCRLRAYGITVPPVSSRPRCVQDQAQLLQLGTQGLRPALAEVIPLAEAHEAHRLLESGAAVGKVLLSCV